MESGYCRCGCGEKTAIATEDSPAYGYRRGEPRAYCNGHHRRKQVRYIEEDHGYETPCWIWQLYVDPGGYGRVTLGPTKKPAHRFMWEEANGPVPEGLQIDHLCRVPTCVNPGHLEPVTPAENTRRGSLTLLSEENVECIRGMLADAQISQSEIARRFGVSKQLISDIALGKAWNLMGVL